jgi:hypothetical protein
MMMFVLHKEAMESHYFPHDDFRHYIIDQHFLSVILKLYYGINSAQTKILSSIKDFAEK